MTLNHFAQFFLLPHCRDRISACIHASDLLDGCTLEYLEYDLIILLLEHIKASAQAMDGCLNFFKDICFENYDTKSKSSSVKGFFLFEI